MEATTGQDFLSALRSADLGDEFWMYQFKYLPDVCPNAKAKRVCPAGDLCPYSHNTFEQWLHPTRYRTRLCYLGATCRRPTCFFAHSVEELRHVEGSDPADLSVQSGSTALSIQLAAAAAVQSQGQPHPAALLAMAPPPLLSGMPRQHLQASASAMLPMLPSTPMQQHQQQQQHPFASAPLPTVSLPAAAMPHAVPVGITIGPQVSVAGMHFMLQPQPVSLTSGRNRSRSVPGDGGLPCGHGGAVVGGYDAGMVALPPVSMHMPPEAQAAPLMPRHTPLPSNRAAASPGVPPFPPVGGYILAPQPQPQQAAAGHGGSPMAATGPPTPTSATSTHHLADAMGRLQLHAQVGGGRSPGMFAQPPPQQQLQQQAAASPARTMQAMLGEPPSSPLGPVVGQDAITTMSAPLPKLDLGIPPAGGAHSHQQLDSLLHVLHCSNDGSSTDDSLPSGGDNVVAGGDAFGERASDPGQTLPGMLKRLSAEVGSSFHMTRNSDPGQTHGSDMVALLPLLQSILNEGLATGQFELVNGQLQLSTPAAAASKAPRMPAPVVPPSAPAAVNGQQQRGSPQHGQ